MNSFKSVLAAMIAVTSLTGCVITVHDDGERSGASWRERQVENRKAISQLQLGTSINQITEQLGGADDSEGFKRDGKSYVVLYYRTTRRHQDGETTRDETTPLIFEDGLLVGWGHSVLHQYR